MRCSKCESLNLEDATTCFNCGEILPRSPHPYEAPAADLTSGPRKGFRAIWILWGCGGLVVAFLLLLASCFLMVKGGLQAGDREFAPAVESYLAKVRAGDYHGAYKDFGEELHSAVKEENYLALEKGFQEKLGPLKEKKPQFVQIGSDLKGKWGRIVYTCEFENAKGTISFSLRKKGDSWSIVEIRYDSPLFLEYLKAKEPS
ncbi:DUF3887 domain-containing protein [Mesoterricola silvestris]|uniref:Uncharacterized protein n=1 Tax=Mesoterricola silvestris TaxID=2927979 RepID=A0AA48H1E1_9BACT|nr:DUF3887 domain-containing protein [Mesoterricola silvestris]BDU74248.1 hypothetical protein METEAL_34220 [Mesoterricola silvestris]